MAACPGPARILSCSDIATASAEIAAIVPGGVCAGSPSGGSIVEPGPRGAPALNPAFIRFTSGTTASWKGVVLSHEATEARVQAADTVLGFHHEDRILWVLPLAYHFAVTIVAYVRAGAHVLMCPDTLPGASWPRSGGSGPASSMRRRSTSNAWAISNRAAPLGSVRLGLSTSAPIAPTVMDRFESRYTVPVGQAYGIIEAGLPCINPRTGACRPAPWVAPSPDTRSPRSRTRASVRFRARRARSASRGAACSRRTTGPGGFASRLLGTGGS